MAAVIITIPEGLYCNPKDKALSFVSKNLIFSESDCPLLADEYCACKYFHTVLMMNTKLSRYLRCSKCLALTKEEKHNE